MRAQFDATGEVVIITGGANGIGASLAKAIARSGGTAIVFDIAASLDLEGLDGVETIQVDVSKRGDVVAAVEGVVARHGFVSGLVAAAAIQPRIPVSNMSEEVWNGVIQVNLDALVWSIQSVLPSMTANRRGSIVLFTSGLAHMGRANASAYAASKGAVIPLAKSLAAEVAGQGVRVNVLAPGVVDTPQFRAANPSGGEREHWVATTGISEPDDVVGSLLFLLSDAATMTGSTLSRDMPFSEVKEDE